MKINSYLEACNYIENVGKFSIKNSNLHTRKCLELLGNPDRRLHTIHVAGTNGKGSVCAFLDSVLRAEGKKTGLFTSPHLVRINERMQIDGNPISDEDFVRVFNTVEEAAQKMEAAGEQRPSYFELLFLMAMVYFSEQGVEIAVIETGLGGRLDATNSLEAPDLTVITSIGFDHMQYLGNTIPEIAGEKAGIIKPGVPVVYDASRPEAAAVIEAKAKELGAPSVALSPSDYEITSSGKGMIDFCTAFRYDGHALFSVYSNAVYQVQNAALAILALKTLQERDPQRFGAPDAETLKKGLLAMRWPGRMEEAAPGVYIDGAHNADGICAFAESVLQLLEGRGAILIFSAVDDKDYTEMIGTLTERIPWKLIFLTEIPGKRKLEGSRIKEAFEEAGRPDVQVIPDISLAYREALAKRDNDLIFIVGSLYLAGMAEELIHDQL